MRGDFEPIQRHLAEAEGRELPKEEPASGSREVRMTLVRRARNAAEAEAWARALRKHARELGFKEVA